MTPEYRNHGTTEAGEAFRFPLKAILLSRLRQLPRKSLSHAPHPFSREIDDYQPNQPICQMHSGLNRPIDK